MERDETTAQDVIDAMRVAVEARQTSIVQTFERLLTLAPETDPKRPISPVLELLTEARNDA